MLNPGLKARQVLGSPQKMVLFILQWPNKASKQKLFTKLPEKAHGKADKVTVTIIFWILMPFGHDQIFGLKCK